MAGSDKPPAPPRPSEPPRTNGCAVLEPPPRPPVALSAERDPPGNAPILVVIHTKEPPLLGRRFVLDRSPFRVGRDAENDIVLQDASVSARHAHFEERDAVWWCVDDGSMDGLFIDDRRTTGRAALANGTRIGVASTIFKFLSGRDREAQYQEEIYQLTVRDGLTQVYGKRFLLEALDIEIVRARRHSRPLCLLMIEVDAIDGSSEPPKVTDHVLKEVARLLRPFAPRDGILARHGDERFAMVLPEYTLERAYTVAESLRDKIADTPLSVGLGELRATVCIGCVQQRDDDRASAHVLNRASLALHVAKSRGCNQLACDAIGEGPDSRPGG